MAHGAVSMVVMRAAAVAGAMVLALTSAGAQATLLGRDIKGNPTATNTDSAAVFEYDTVLNITWLRNWNVNGAQDWATQVAWASGLTVGTFAGWRLPATDTTSSSNCDSNFNPGSGFPQQYNGYGCTGSEMGELWYDELGNTAGTLTTSSPFLNMQRAYWSGTAYAPSSTSHAWYFNPNNGVQGTDGKNDAIWAVAVRAGDVDPVPEPGSLALALLGLGAAAIVRRRGRGAIWCAAARRYFAAAST